MPQDLQINMTSPTYSFRSKKFLLSGALLAVTVVAAPSSALAMDLTGWAWSGGSSAAYMGWINFGNFPGATYGVDEDATGALSGYAWSSNLGWISFNAADVTGCLPGAPQCAPKVDLDSGSATFGRLTGWARACAAFSDPNACVGTVDSGSGGWDGWIALSGTALDTTPYYITQSADCTWSGYMWGSDAIGAISVDGIALDGIPYRISGNDPSLCAGTNNTLAIAVNPSDYPVTLPDTTVTALYTLTNGNSTNTTCQLLDNTGAALGTSSACTGDASGIGGTLSVTAPTTAGGGVYGYSIRATKSGVSAVSNTFTVTVSPAPPSCVENAGQACTAAIANSCGNTDSTILCDGLCPTPSEVTCGETLPTVDITADPERVLQSNFSTRISWSSTNADSCTVSSSPAGLLSSTDPEGQQVVTISRQSVFTITCSNVAGSDTKSKVVNMPIGFEET